MSPEFNIRLVVDLPSVSKADAFAAGLKDTLRGVKSAQVEGKGNLLGLSDQVNLGGFADMNFGQTLRWMRSLEGLNQRELAQRAGIHPSTLNRMETDQLQRHRTRANTVFRITNALGWSPEDPRTQILIEKASEISR